MDDDAFDRALISAAFAQAAALGWRHLSIVGAARDSGLPLPRARARFPSRGALLLRFGRIADQAALAEATGEGTVRDQLFDLIMRRIDVLQAHRSGVLALFRALPCDPPTAVLLTCATKRSLRWMAQAAGVDLHGLRGELKLRGLLGVWLWTVRAWERDETTDLSATMAALDNALNRAEQAARWLHRCRAAKPDAAAAPPPSDPPPFDPPSDPPPFPPPGPLPGSTSDPLFNPLSDPLPPTTEPSSVTPGS